MCTRYVAFVFGSIFYGPVDLLLYWASLSSILRACLISVAHPYKFPSVISTFYMCIRGFYCGLIITFSLNMYTRFLLRINTDFPRTPEIDFYYGSVTTFDAKVFLLRLTAAFNVYTYDRLLPGLIPVFRGDQIDGRSADPTRRSRGPCRADPTTLSGRSQVNSSVPQTAHRASICNPPRPPSHPRASASSRPPHAALASAKPHSSPQTLPQLAAMAWRLRRLPRRGTGRRSAWR